MLNHFISHKLVTDFLQLGAQLFQGAVAVYLVGDILAEGVPEHSLPVVFIHPVFLTEIGKGMPAVVGSMLLDMILLQEVIHVPAEGICEIGRASCRERVSLEV